ncbi:hypothetical protein LIER_39889 [Lithospermum erythrorhizon]|uniref:Reverse transcriptase Ty1/copia-type domain-containing protein n=1 Tax=Lithospermum erythrorhizon TaxID=34254 RepID=A0AAV3QQT5_LITER
MASRDARFWKEVINDEMNFIMSNGTWKIVDLHPVSRITSIRMLFALASIYNLYVHQMDVKTAFLNGDLTEEVYMEQPEGFILLGNEHKVCRLVKSLYGLKQVSKQWHKKFDDVILANGFKHNGAFQEIDFMPLR